MMKSSKLMNSLKNLKTNLYKISFIHLTCQMSCYYKQSGYSRMPIYETFFFGESTKQKSHIKFLLLAYGSMFVAFMVKF